MNTLEEKYSDIEALTPGKNAAVFRAVNKRLGREVFLKIYAEMDEAAFEMREPRLLARFQHDRLVSIFSADPLDGGRVVLEMEMLREGSFQALIDASEASGKWPEVHTVAHLVSDAAAGLGHLHANGYVHRDVKPANLMLKRDNQRVIGVVTDLGMAAKLGLNGRAGASRQARLYRPPEAWAGKGYSPSSDVYQLAIVFFQMLGGRINYGISTLDDTELAKAIRERALLNWRSLGPHIDRPIRSVIEKALETESNRYTSMVKFRTAINNALNRQFDWAYAKKEQGFTLQRIDPRRRSVRLVVERKQAAYVVQRFKKAIGPEFRRVGEAVEIKHADLSSCREFQNLLKEEV
jgi:serine/threonine protein kinase